MGGMVWLLALAEEEGFAGGEVIGVRCVSEM